VLLIAMLVVSAVIRFVVLLSVVCLVVIVVMLIVTGLGGRMLGRPADARPWCSRSAIREHQDDPVLPSVT
jgi:hypothetical protein